MVKKKAIKQLSLFDNNATDAANATSVAEDANATSVAYNTNATSVANGADANNATSVANADGVLKQRAKMYRRSSRPNMANVVADEELSPTVLKGILYERSAGREMDEDDKNSTEEYREYYNAKMVALALEEKNNSRIIAFPSVGTKDDEWYKVGGNSALFYKYYVGPRLKRHPKFRNDTDLRHRFKHGVIAIHWGEHFIKSVEELGYKAKRSEFGLIICDLGRKWSARDITEMHKKEKQDQEKVKRMIVPKYNYPDIYGNLNVLARLLPAKIKKMDAAYRGVIGEEMLVALVALYKDYFKVANGHLPLEGSAEVLLRHTDDMTAVLAIIDENNLLDLPTRTRLGAGLVDLKHTIVRRLK